MAERTTVIFQRKNSCGNGICVYMLPIKLFDRKLKTLFPYSFFPKKDSLSSKLLHKSQITSMVRATSLWYQQKEELFFFLWVMFYPLCCLQSLLQENTPPEMRAHEHQGKLAPGRSSSPSVKHCEGIRGEMEDHQANRADMATHELSLPRE